MSLLITNKCINCDMCRQECPNQAIIFDSEQYYINPDLCTECIGYYDKPTCQTVCPIKNTIIYDTNNYESKESLLKKFIKLKKSN
uniref:YfhL family 4Fe-4S dicluster ferredoxin n=1 Tax=Candidatus Aschnera chinzeii TaxID=1485666 RepID=A0AAT9G3V1_9ENTR|nr:MAG: YfhL family 4Fe-4S dicluster ferredoxin [Candidatus Aschnera chinzeii]